MENTSQAERPASRACSLMDPSLYEAAMEGMRNVLEQKKDQLDVLVSPNNNTVLHIAVQFGKQQCMKDILEMCPIIYDRLNSKGETPLHVAAREGHSDIVQALIEHAKDEERGHGVKGAAKEMLLLANKNNDTALHEAVRIRHAELVELLIIEAPELSHIANDAEETPLYLAAERGYHDLVSLILRNCTSPGYGGPFGRTALHAAVLHDYHRGSFLHANFFQKMCKAFLVAAFYCYWSYPRTVLPASIFHGLEECTKQLLDWKQALLKEADMYGWMPLHYAARCGSVSTVTQLLDKDISLAYLTTKKDDEMTTAVHIAATCGHVDVMKVLISKCPGCWEMFNGTGQNILHIAVKNEKKRVIKFILGNSSLNSLINQKDDDGNTPLHLLAASNCYLPELIKHPVADKSALNKEDLTPLNIVSYRRYNKSQIDVRILREKYYIQRDLKRVGAPMGRRNIINKDKDEIAARKHENVVSRDMRKAADTHLIVAALIATVTFAAGFTVPGGFDGNEGPNKGLSILTRKAAFKAFVITDATAMILSTCAIFFYFAAANFTDKRQLQLQYMSAQSFTLAAMTAAMIAFMTGMYAVLSNSPFLAITQCLIGCLIFTYTNFALAYQDRYVRE